MARVLLTRARGRNRALADALSHLDCVVVPLIGFEPVPHTLPGHVDRVVVTSATVFRVASLPQAPLAVVGPATLHAARAHGFEPDVVAPKALGASLVDALGDVDGQRVLYPRAETVPPGFEAALTQRGAQLISVPVYRTMCPPDAQRDLAHALPADWVVFCSGSAARHWVACEGPALPAVCIGPSTAAVCRDLGLPIAAVADPHTTAGVVQAVAQLTDTTPGSGPW
jgi:uroporphyrinogen-III synthase